MCREIRQVLTGAISLYIPQLKTFFAVTEAGSFSKAAAELYMTPGAVLHQIRTLEKDLGSELFIRTPQGVILTPAGQYLERNGRNFMQLGEEIRRGIREIASSENTICIGTSMLEKCRLLYDLWVLFSQEEQNCRIQMVNIDVGHEIPDGTDLIESLNSNIPWMRDWEFLQICEVPFGCAFVRDHPLAQKERITVADLQGETVRTINDGSCETITRLLKLLRESGINVVYNFGTGMHIFWESAFRRDVQLVPMCFHDILINMKVVPFEPSFSLPYGIFHRPDPKGAVKKFLEFIELTYCSGNTAGIVPVLE